MIHRRQFLVSSGACIAAAIVGPVWAQGSKGEPRAPAGSAVELSVRPGRVFKRSSDQNRLRQEYWLFTLVLLSPEPRKRAIEQLLVRYESDGEVRRITTYPKAAADALDLVPSVTATPGGGPYPVAAFQVADAMAAALAIDHAVCEVSWRDDDGALQRAERRIALEVYAQRTALVFPFVGQGMITQGGAWNDGHRNRSGMFAIDAIGLTDAYAAMVGEGDAPAAVAGWGRPVIAPAAGTVVVVRSDRPDQPVSGVSDPKYFVPEFPQGGDPGNHVVLDHGNGEFSMLAHFQHDSLRVRVGDRVKQGQPLGLLGNSGDTNTPHVHHQLQSGPDWTTADALPHAYTNGPENRHDRGVMFDAR